MVLKTAEEKKGKKNETAGPYIVNCYRNSQSFEVTQKNRDSSRPLLGRIYRNMRHRYPKAPEDHIVRVTREPHHRQKICN